MVTSPSGKGVVIVGGYNATTMKYSKALLELKSNFTFNKTYYDW